MADPTDGAVVEVRTRLVIWRARRIAAGGIGPRGGALEPARPKRPDFADSRLDRGLRPVDVLSMRIAVFILLLVVGAVRTVEDPISRGLAGPPIEIRLVGEGTPALESRIAEVQERFPRLQRRRTTQFEILTDLEPGEAGRHTELLERTSLAVDRFCRIIGVDRGRRTAGRHLVLGFSDRRDFLEFAAWSDDVHARWLAGYFAPAAGHLAYHHQSDSPYARSRRRSIDTSVDLSPDESEATSESFVTDVRRDRLNAFIAHETSSVVVHETVHMLLHHRDVVPATTSTPIWFLEGLAGSFEPASAFGAFGPDHDANGRTEEFRRHLAANRQFGIREMATLETVPERSDRRSAFYATSAQFCGWLVRHRPDDVRRFIDVVRYGTGADRLENFEAVFGPCDEIERTWLADERSRAANVRTR